MEARVPTVVGTPLSRARCCALPSASPCTRLCRSLLPSPHLPTTRPCNPASPSSSSRRLFSGPASLGAVPWNCRSSLPKALLYSPSSLDARLSTAFAVLPWGYHVGPALITFSSARSLGGYPLACRGRLRCCASGGRGRRYRRSGTLPFRARTLPSSPSWSRAAAGIRCQNSPKISESHST